MSTGTVVTCSEIAQRNANLIQPFAGDYSNDVYAWAHLRHLGLKTPRLLDQLWRLVQQEWEITLPPRQDASIRFVQDLNAAVAAALKAKGITVQETET